MSDWHFSYWKRSIRWAKFEAWLWIGFHSILSKISTQITNKWIEMSSTELRFIENFWNANRNGTKILLSSISLRQLKRFFFQEFSVSVRVGAQWIWSIQNEIQDDTMAFSQIKLVFSSQCKSSEGSSIVMIRKTSWIVLIYWECCYFRVSLSRQGTESDSNTFNSNEQHLVCSIQKYFHPVANMFSFIFMFMIVKIWTETTIFSWNILFKF